MKIATRIMNNILLVASQNNHQSMQTSMLLQLNVKTIRVRNLKFATYLKFATCENTNKINELW